MTTHTLSVLVENKPGVLAHVAGLFSRRAFNISSLAVGPTADEGVSRMTIVLDGESTPVGQVMTQLDKLVRVLKVVELTRGSAVERELALIKVRAEPGQRGQLHGGGAGIRRLGGRHEPEHAGAGGGQQPRQARRAAGHARRTTASARSSAPAASRWAADAAAITDEPAACRGPASDAAA